MRETARDKRKSRTASYEEGLRERLKDPEYAVGYLNACLEDISNDEWESTFLLARRDVARAHGIAQVSNDAKLARDSFYKALAKGGNPTFSTLNAILDAVGMRIEIRTKTG